MKAAATARVYLRARLRGWGGSFVLGDWPRHEPQHRRTTFSACMGAQMSTPTINEERNLRDLSSSLFIGLMVLGSFLELCCVASCRKVRAVRCIGG